MEMITRVRWIACRGISWNDVEIMRLPKTAVEEDIQEIGMTITDEIVHEVHILDDGECIWAYAPSDDLVFIINEVQNAYHRSLAASEGIGSEKVPTMEYVP